LQLFSGGIDSCLGSSDFNLCTSVFLLDNSDVELGSSFEGEIRALAASAYGFATRSGIYLDQEDVQAFGRALIVKGYSVVGSFL